LHWVNYARQFCCHLCLIRCNTKKQRVIPLGYALFFFSKKWLAHEIFYKYVHFICRTMTERGLSYLIVGHNKGQKQNINMGKTNQAFVAVPFSRFNTILSSTARQYGICVILQEESYTSKACFAAKDFIPTYGQEDAEKAVFSGKRTHRGLYRQNDGKVINADVNGSANIGRKYNEEVFADVKDIGYLYKTVKAMTYRDILDVSHKYTTKK